MFLCGAKSGAETKWPLGKSDIHKKTKSTAGIKRRGKADEEHDGP